MSRSLFSPRRFRSRCAPWCLGALVVFAVQASLADLEPTAEDRIITREVVDLLRREQLTRHPLDDEISQWTANGFIKMLDPMKVYFLQPDIDSFMRYAKDLDEQLKAGDTSFSRTVFKKLLERIGERVQTVNELLDSDIDFSADEEMVLEPDAAPKDAVEARERWRQRIKYELLSLKADKASKQENGKSATEQDPRARLRRRYKLFAKRMEETDHQELLEMYLTSLTTSFDPHSTYMAPKTVENFDIVMRLNLEGIGASLLFDDGYTVVKDLIPGGAADKDGRLKPDDRIVGVGQGEEGEIVDTMDMKLSDVVEKIRGKRGTTVRLEVIPAGTQDRQVYKIVRDKIELTDSEARAQIIERERNGHKFRIGVIDLPSFYMDMEGARRGNPEFKSTARDMTRLLRKFREEKDRVDAVVLDLRRNGGGSLSEAISVTGLFVNGPIVQVKDKNGDLQVYDDEPGIEWDGPLVVLTSRLSASASEIFAGAIRDYDRGIIVGDSTTHGKGTVQSLLDLSRPLFGISKRPKLGALKITMQQFYRPDGDSTQNEGVKSHVVLPSMTEVLKGIGESDLEHALAFDHVDPAKHDRRGLVNEQIVKYLNAASAKRRESDEGFQKLLRNMKRYEEQKNRKSVTLQEQKFVQERAELNAEAEEEKELDESSHSHRVVFDEKWFYNQEVLEITLDYLSGLGRPSGSEPTGQVSSRGK